MKSRRCQYCDYMFAWPVPPNCPLNKELCTDHCILNNEIIELRNALPNMTGLPKIAIQRILKAKQAKLTKMKKETTS